MSTWYLISASMLFSLVFLTIRGTQASTLRIGYMWEDDEVSSDQAVSDLLSHVTTTVLSESGNTVSIIGITRFTSMFEAHLAVAEYANTTDLVLLAPVRCSSLASLESAFLQPAASPALVMTYPTCSDDSLCLTHPEISAALVDLMKYANWSDILLIYDQDHEEIARTTSQLLDHITYQNSSVKHATYKVQNVTVSSALEILSKSHVTAPSVVRFLLLCGTDCASAFLQAANMMDALNEKQGLYDLFSEWLILTNETEHGILVNVTKDLCNVVFLSPSLTQSNSAEAVLLGNRPQITKEIVDFSRGNSTLHLNGCSFGVVCPNIYQMEGYSFLQLTAYTVSRNGPYRENKTLLTACHWDIQNGVQCEERLFPHKGYFLNNVTLQVATHLQSPWVTRDNSTKWNVSGICIELLQLLGQSLNFSYTLAEPDDGEWGVRKDGNWTGVVGMLQRKEADLIVGPIGVSKERNDVIDFTHPFYVDHYTVGYKREDPAVTKYRLYIEPFRWQVWLCVAASVIITGVILFLVHRYSPHYSPGAARQGLGDVQWALWFCYGSMLQQSAYHEPSAWSDRFIVGFWWIYAIILVAVYTGNLIAFLTVNLEFPPFIDVSGMVDQTKVHYGLLSKTHIEEVIMQSNESLYQKVADGIRSFAETDPAVLSMDAETHLQRLNSTTQYAFIAERTLLQITALVQCNLTLLKQNFQTVQYAIGLQKNSAFTHLFSSRIMQFLESGYFGRWENRHWPPSTKCERITNSAKNVRLIDMQGAYYLLGISLVLCFVVLLVEIIRGRIQRRRKELLSARDVKINMIKWDMK